MLAMIPEVLANPGGTIHGVLDEDPAAIKAAYRLFDSQAVTHTAVLAPHRRWVAREIARAGTYLLIEDTTSVVPASQNAWGLGPVDNDGLTTGFWLHSTLAVGIEFPDPDSDCNRVTVIGLLGQKAWVRDMEKKPRKESKAQSLARPRESQKWGECLSELTGELKPAARSHRIYVADRESDVWEAMQRCQSAGVSFVIRCGQDRALTDRPELLHAAVDAMAVREKRRVELPRSQGQASRSADLQLRFGPLPLRAPARPGKPAGSDTLEVHAVHLREIGMPEGTEPVEWLLLTTEPVKTITDAWRVVAIYKRRWLIEEFHKGLKTGAGLENSQLGDVRKLMAWCGVLSVVTTWLLRQKVCCALPDQPPLKPGEADEELLSLLEARRQKRGKPPVPEEGWTARSITHAIARAGGFLGRKCDGNPGWLSLWRGWTRLQNQLIGFRLAREMRK